MSFLENRIGVTDDNVAEEMNRLHINKISNKEENDRILKKLNKTLKNHKYIKKIKGINLRL